MKIPIKIFLQKFFFLLYITMINNHYQKHKEKFRKEAREIYQNLSEEQKEKERQYLREGRENVS